ncbi:MAG TPA: ribonuclease H [Sulfurimonas sp.]|nr:ribonuclease H [Sulfurimonas sp.]HIM75731.1 ribonuclease H [Campylobacterales bacterium]
MNKTKPQIYLFTDGSVNPQSEIGFGAYLLLDKLDYICELEKEVKVKKFTNTSSTKLELETLLWALSDISSRNHKIVIYSDCQNIIGLKDRRDRFEKNKYITGKGKLIKNHELYKEFFKLIDNLDCEFIKVKGHKKSSTKDEVDEIFTLVDRATRNALRNSLLC